MSTNFVAMNRMFAIVFLLIFSVYSLSQMVVFASYILNLDYIVENLCENRDKPELECNGMCHLKKELKKDEDRKSSDDFSSVEISLCYSIVPKIEIKSEQLFFEELVDHQFYYNYSNSIQHLSGVFHPPCGIA